MSWLFATPCTAVCQTSLALTISQFAQVHVHWTWMLVNRLIICHHLLLCLQCIPASGSFPMSQNSFAALKNMLDLFNLFPSIVLIVNTSLFIVSLVLSFQKVILWSMWTFIMVSFFHKEILIWNSSMSFIPS